MKALGAEVCAFKREVEEFFFSVSPLGLKTMNFQFLDYFVEDVRLFRHISALDAFAYELFNVQIKMVYQGSSRNRAMPKQETVMLNIEANR